MWNKIKNFIQYIKDGIETIKEYDSELTELTWVSSEPIENLKKIQEEAFENATKCEAYEEKERS